MTHSAFSEICWKGSQTATTLYVLVMVSLFPLFTGVSGYMYLQLKKYLFFLGATLIWALVLCVFALLRLLRERQLHPPAFPLLCVLAFACMASISTWRSDEAVFFSTIVGKYDCLLTYLLYCFVLYGVYRFGTNLQCCLVAFAVSYTVFCGIAIIQLLGFNVLWLFPDELTYYSPEVQETGAFLSTLGNVDAGSVLHCLALPLLASTLAFGTGKKRWLLCVPLLLGVISQVCAGVAAGLLAVGITSVLLIPASAVWLLRSRRGVKARRWLAFSGALLLLCALVFVYLVPFKQGILYELHASLHGNLQDSFGSHRILIWRKTAEVIRSNILFGIGPDTLGDHLDILFERYSETLNVTLHTTVDTAHSMYLQLLASFGMLGCIPLSILMVSTLDRIHVGFSQSKTQRILFPPLLSYLIQAFFNVSTCMIAPLFMILWGLLLHHSEPVQPTEPNQENRVRETAEP